MVTVALPVRDAAPTISVAVRSILDQSFQDWELLLIDDGSTDGSAEQARATAAGDERVRVFGGGDCRGLATRLNEAVSLAQGIFFARMDADDVSYPERLAVQVRYLLDHPEVDLVATGVMVFRSDGTVRGRRSSAADHAVLTRHPLRAIPMAHPTWMGRTSWFAAHPYDGSASRCEDQDLLLRAHKTSCYAVIPQILLGYREDRLKLRAVLSSRIHQSRSLWRYARAAGTPLGGAQAVALQVLKAIVDLTASFTGAEEIRLRQRAGCATEAEEEAWQDLWLRF
jgi:glycosyltransferase involved in cell wall biosynthesis